MNELRYAEVLKKASSVLQEKQIPETQICFRNIRVSFLAEKAFWFVSGVKRKLMRRRGK